MAIITKSLIWVTMMKHEEKGLSRNRALIETANELGLTHNEVRKSLYPGEINHSKFDTKDFVCDPKWLEKVLELEKISTELSKRTKYMLRLLNYIDEPSVPVENTKIESTKMLANNLLSSINAIIPKEVCPDCIDSYDPYCKKCNGFKWIA